MHLMQQRPTKNVNRDRLHLRVGNAQLTMTLFCKMDINCPLPIKLGNAQIV